MIELIFIVPLCALVVALILICVYRSWRASRYMEHLYATDNGDEENPITEEDVRSGMNTRVLNKSSLRSGRRKKQITCTEVEEDYIDLEESMKSGISIASFSTSTNHGSVCPICLDTFKVGDEVASSTNGRCAHVFHASCIIEWLMKPKSGGCCPVCRQGFLINDSASEGTRDGHSSEEEIAL